MVCEITKETIDEFKRLQEPLAKWLISNVSDFSAAVVILQAVIDKINELEETFTLETVPDKIEELEQKLDN